MSHLEVRAHLAALFVALSRNGQLEAARALWDWSQEWLELEEGFDEEIENELDAPLS
jgi:hypothetical protein